MESAKYTIKESVQAIQKLDFGEDTWNIKQYSKKKKQNNDISEIINMERQDISPARYHMLRNSQPTSASVEKTFSMLKKDRNFKAENVRHYMISRFNASTRWLLACRVNYCMSQDLICFAIAIALCSKFCGEIVCIFVC